MNSIRKLLRDLRGELDEAALVLPVLLLISLGLVNLGILGFAAINAGNAANYGARHGLRGAIRPNRCGSFECLPDALCRAGRELRCYRHRLWPPG